jgi:hypothetical protein
MFKILIFAGCLLLAGALASDRAAAQPYEFVEEREDYTWGEDTAKVLSDLGEPYSQDSAGLTYLVNEHWVKRIQLTGAGRVWQVTDQLVYPKNAPAAQREFALLTGKLEQMYGPPSSRSTDCPSPDGQSDCQISRWDQHPLTRVAVARISTPSGTSVTMAYGAPELRQQDENTRPDQAVDIGDIIKAYQQDPQAAARRYQGQELAIIGQNGGLTKDQDGRLYITLHNAFAPDQQARCYLRAGQETSFTPYRDAGSLLARGFVGD